MVRNRHLSPHNLWTSKRKAKPFTLVGHGLPGGHLLVLWNLKQPVLDVFLFGRMYKKGCQRLPFLKEKICFYVGCNQNNTLVITHLHLKECKVHARLTMLWTASWIMGHHELFPPPTTTIICLEHTHTDIYELQIVCFHHQKDMRKCKF